MRYYFLLGGFAYITDTDTFTRTNLEITDSLLVELNGTGAIEVQSTFDYVQDEGYGVFVALFKPQAYRNGMGVKFRALFTYDGIAFQHIDVMLPLSADYAASEGRIGVYCSPRKGGLSATVVATRKFKGRDLECRFTLTYGIDGGIASFQPKSGGVYAVLSSDWDFLEALNEEGSLYFDMQRDKSVGDGYIEVEVVGSERYGNPALYRTFLL